MLTNKNVIRILKNQIDARGFIINSNDNVVGKNIAIDMDLKNSIQNEIQNLPSKYGMSLKDFSNSIYGYLKDVKYQNTK